MLQKGHLCNQYHVPMCLLYVAITGQKDAIIINVIFMKIILCVCVYCAPVSHHPPSVNTNTNRWSASQFVCVLFWGFLFHKHRLHKLANRGCCCNYYGVSLLEVIV